MERELEGMWNVSTQEIVDIDPASENWKIQTLPLARVKKIMKSEEIILQELEKGKLQREDGSGGGNNDEQEKPSVKFMISGEAPVLMSKACELLIKDLSFRAWRHTERNRRRTLQRQDLHAAVGESEVYDFLIDIVPRVTTTTTTTTAAEAAKVPPTMNTIGEMGGTALPHNLPQMSVALTHAPGLQMTQTPVIGAGPTAVTGPGTIDPNHQNTAAILSFQPPAAVDINDTRGVMDPQYFMTFHQMQGTDGSDAAAAAAAAAAVAAQQGGQNQQHQLLQQQQQQQQQPPPVQHTLQGFAQHQSWGDAAAFGTLGGSAPTQSPGL